jgi:hypothetical protein
MTLNLEGLTLSKMWLLVVAITIATTVIFWMYREHIKLGLRALMTWGADGVDKLHEEHGKVKTVFWTFMMWWVGSHTLCLIVIWIGVILWTLGIWTPHQ